MSIVSFKSFAHYWAGSGPWVSGDWGSGAFYFANTGAGCLIAIVVSDTSKTITSLTMTLPIANSNATYEETCAIDAYLYESSKISDTNTLKPLKSGNDYNIIPETYTYETTSSSYTFGKNNALQNVTFTFNNLNITGSSYIYIKLKAKGGYIKVVNTPGSTSVSSTETSGGGGGGGGTTTYQYKCYNITHGQYITSSAVSATSSPIYAPDFSSYGYAYQGYKLGSSSWPSTSGTSYTSTSTAAAVSSSKPYCIFFYAYTEVEEEDPYTYCCYDLTNKKVITGSEQSTSNSSITRPDLIGYNYEGYVYHSDQAQCISWQKSNGYDSTGTTCSSHKSTYPYVVFFYTKTPTTYTVQCYDYKYNSSGGQLGYQVNSITKPYAAGSTVDGSAWGEDSPWEGYEYGGCSSISVSSTKKTVERYFYPISYDVQYHLNGASGTAPTSTKRRYNETYKLTSTEPKRDGYNFKGWNTDPNASTGYTDKDTMSASTSMEITHYYAIWEQIFYYRAYDVTNNKYLDTSPSTSTASSITCPSAPTGYTYAGYKYHTNFENCESQSSYDGTGTSCSTHSSFPYILFCYEQIKYYITVKYHINDGSDNIFETKNYDSTAINVPFNIIKETPTRDKYEFLGWSSYASDTTPDYQPDEKNFTYPGNPSSENPAICNLYAVWKRKGNVYYCINNEWFLCETYIYKNGKWVSCQFSYSPDGTSWEQ